MHFNNNMKYPGLVYPRGLDWFTIKWKCFRNCFPKRGTYFIHIILDDLLFGMFGYVNTTRISSLAFSVACILCSVTFLGNHSASHVMLILIFWEIDVQRSCSYDGRFLKYNDSILHIRAINKNKKYSLSRKWTLFW